MQHLNIFQAHKRNVFEINLPNKVTKIMAVPPRGTVKDAIQPVLKKQGYSFDIMELRFANNFKVSRESWREREREREERGGGGGGRVNLCLATRSPVLDKLNKNLTT